MAGIQSLIENEDADEWVRCAALNGLVTLVAAGQKSRDEIVSYFTGLFRGRLPRQVVTRLVLPRVCFSASILLLGFVGSSQTRTARKHQPVYTQDGQLRLPAGYREWVFLSSGFDMSYNPDMAMDHQMFDSVFADPESWKAFQSTGKWPDKTLLVLELRRAEGKGSINKKGNSQTEAMGIEVHVKDESRFRGK